MKQVKIIKIERVDGGIWYQKYIGTIVSVIRINYIV